MFAKLKGTNSNDLDDCILVSQSKQQAQKSSNENANGRMQLLHGPAPSPHAPAVHNGGMSDNADECTSPTMNTCLHCCLQQSVGHEDKLP